MYGNTTSIANGPSAIATSTRYSVGFRADATSIDTVIDGSAGTAAARPASVAAVTDTFTVGARTNGSFFMEAKLSGLAVFNGTKLTTAQVAAATDEILSLAEM